MCFLSPCLAAVPVNELVTCISRLVPRYVLPADCFSSSDVFLHFDSVFLFHVCVCLHSRWMEITDSALSFSSSFPSPFSSLAATQPRLGFPNSRLCRGSLESNPAIIAGWSGLENTGEGKWIAYYGAFQIQTPYKAFVDYYCAAFTRIYPPMANHPARDEGQRLRNVLRLQRLSHGQW